MVRDKIEKKNRQAKQKKNVWKKNEKKNEKKIFRGKIEKKNDGTKNNWLGAKLKKNEKKNYQRFRVSIITYVYFE